MYGDESVSKLKNIGESRRRAFERVGVTQISDLLRYYPRAYQNRGKTLTLAEIRERLEAGETGPFSTILTVATEPKARMIRRGMTIMKVRAFDEDGTVEITYFNQAFLKDTFKVGSVFRFWGKFALSKSRLEANSLIPEPVIEGRELLPIVPVYPMTQGLSQKIVSSCVSEALRLALPETEEYLAGDVLSDAKLPTTAYAIRNIHFPETESALETAKRRLIFDELFISSLSLSVFGGKKKTASRAEMKNADISAFEEVLPFSFTGAQKRSVDEITSDMSSGIAMNRMLTGDVGSGKTAVAAAAAYMCLNNGHDCLFMVPTEILAAQHYGDLSRLFSPLGLEVYLLTGSTKASEKRTVLEALASARPTLVIGTHALLSDNVIPSSLGLVIIDEQHRFGAMQRAALAAKSEGINTLVMSATPIPRTLSLILCGSLDVSRIDELPAGRKPVGTFVVDESYRERLNGFIAKQVAEGHQVYVVCPSIEENKETKQKGDNPEEMADIPLFSLFEDETVPPLKAVMEFGETLCEALPGVNVAVVHGKMKTAEREEIMSRFCAGEIDVLVSTTVIEVGVNVPNATLMVAENAERFGLS
ncbi:MAG: ATP-dependent DNA helicase RecG, partial [Clostridia bacterium]|nr:ATP-dependent DNA helicase RecG [Clostridia bacterium]